MFWEENKGVSANNSGVVKAFRKVERRVGGETKI
jgi:hypothetical protein